MPPTDLPRARRGKNNTCGQPPNRTAICPQSDSDSGQFQYDLKEADEAAEGLRFRRCGPSRVSLKASACQAGS